MTFQTKTFLGIALIETFFLAILVILATSFIADSNRSLFESKAEATLSLLELSSIDALLTYDIARLESIAQSVMRDPDILSLKMEISGSEVVSLGHRDAYYSNSGIIEGLSLKAVDIKVGGLSIGRIEAIFDERAILNHIENSNRHLIMIASLEVAFVAIVSLLFSWVLVKELRKLTQAVESIEINGPGRTIAHVGDDEIAQVIAAFNRMSLGLKEQYEQLSLAKEQAQLANSAKDDFLAMVSHEMRTPLNGILGMAQLLEAEVDEGKKEQVNIIVSSGEHLLFIINDILDISKIEHGKLELSIEPFSLESLVEEVKHSFDSVCQQKKLEYIVTTEYVKGIYLVGDKARVKQIIFNLLGNAIKFTEKGVISCHFCWQCNLSILTVTVSDTGIGIAQDKFDMIFEPFSQADNSTTRNFGGTGLGLSISKKLLELMSGKIELFSKVNFGSKFTVTLPLSPTISPSSALKNTNSSHLPTLLAGQHILIIDDNKINLLVGKHFFKKLGLNVESTMDPNEGISLIRSKSYLFVLVDNHMPEISGPELMKMAVQSGEKPIFFGWTADMSAQSIKDFEQAGAQGVLPKPLTNEDLQKIVTSLSASD
ncbi:ATP-binding protein [Vibrio crassostreae]|uniref:ATP-binding protein n=1 Tax=Vibrio crassostreae TaxID=246167 RepID=UPI001B30E481|nr:ATP-binding protein [Vibrio crassostreae]